MTPLGPVTVDKIRRNGIGGFVSLATPPLSAFSFLFPKYVPEVLFAEDLFETNLPSLRAYDINQPGWADED
jgi:hypothetical protein